MDVLEIQLASVSPVSFMVARVGDLVQIKHVPPKPREYRDKIGPPAESFLIFKGQTKIGMIPKQFLDKHGATSLGKSCRIAKIDRDRQVIIVALQKPRMVAQHDS
jgi:hypothetical protein